MARIEQQPGLFDDDAQLEQKAETACTAFDQFWQAYPRREKKLRALAAWNTLKPSKVLITQIMAALEWQVTRPEWAKEHGQFIPLAASWLRAGQWLDEPQIAPRSPHWSDGCQHQPKCQLVEWHRLKLSKGE